MAKELKVALVCLASYRASVRSGTINVRSRPICVTAAMIESDADPIMMIYRDEVYDDRPPSRVAELIIRKATKRLQWEW